MCGTEQTTNKWYKRNWGWMWGNDMNRVLTMTMGCVRLPIELQSSNSHLSDGKPIILFILSSHNELNFFYFVKAKTNSLVIYLFDVVSFVLFSRDSILI